jgi:hypothetical protein
MSSHSVSFRIGCGSSLIPGVFNMTTADLLVNIPTDLLPLLRAEMTASVFNFDDQDATAYALALIHQLSVKGVASPVALPSASERVRAALAEFRTRLNQYKPDWRRELLAGLKSIEAQQDDSEECPEFLTLPLEDDLFDFQGSQADEDEPFALSRYRRQQRKCDH